jgi:hypothetical protein
MIADCILEGSPIEIQEFFSTKSYVTFANQCDVNDYSIINFILASRCIDPELLTLVKAAMSQGINIHAVNNEGTMRNGYSALHQLIRITREDPDTLLPSISDTLAFLCSQNVGINQFDCKGFTPLAVATCHFDPINVQVVECLLKHGLDPNQPYTNKDTLIIPGLVYLFYDNWNKWEPDEEIEDSIFRTMELLIEYGANLDLKAKCEERVNGKYVSRYLTIIDYLREKHTELINGDTYWQEKAKHFEKVIQAYLDKSVKPRHCSNI